MTPNTRQIARRRIASGSAWAVPLIVVGAAAPAASASHGPCPTLASWGTWTASSTGTNSGGCGGAQPGADGKWWQWCDGPIGGTTPYTYTRCTTLTVTAGHTYTLTFTTQANSGVPTPDSPASLVLRIGGTQYWAGYTRSSTGATANPGGANSNLLSTLRGGGANYTDQTWTVTFVATTTGSVAVCFKWTATPRQSGGSTDDIGVTVPSVSCR